MARFRVSLEGRNFLLNQDGVHGCYGFHACRLVTADSLETASKTALIQIHRELNRVYRFTDLGEKRRHQVEVIKIETLKRYQLVRKKSVSGFVFFPTEDDPRPPLI